MGRFCCYSEKFSKKSSNLATLQMAANVSLAMLRILTTFSTTSLPKRGTNKNFYEISPIVSLRPDIARRSKPTRSCGSTKPNRCCDAPTMARRRRPACTMPSTCSAAASTTTKTRRKMTTTTMSPKPEHDTKNATRVGGGRSNDQNCVRTHEQIPESTTIWFIQTLNGGKGVGGGHG